MHVVLIETSGNQSFIFASNKLREAVGASELVYRCGTQWALEAVQRAGGPALWHEQAADLRAALLDARSNQPIERGDTAVEVVHATSGKALLLVADEDTGREVIRHVTRRALEHAPGLDVFGVVGEAFEWQPGEVAQAVAQAHRLHARERRSRPQVAERLPRLPPVAACSTTSWPAMALQRDPDGERRPRSRVAEAKFVARDAAKRRLERLGAGVGLAYDVNELVERLGEADWVAVVHADGNGLGTVFTRFADHVEPGDREPNRAYVDDLRSFSLAVDACTEQAFRAALRHLPRKGHWVPVVPLIVGGDDLTVLCEGRAALGFTAAYLEEFERATSPGGLGVDGPRLGALRDIVPAIMRRAQGTARIGCSGGVAVVKPHFPFREAYDLAAELTLSAKQVKTEAGPAFTALDFHVALDSTDLDLDRIRQNPALTMRPYVVTPQTDLGAPAGGEWRTHRHWDDLKGWAQLLRDKDEDGRRLLPNSQLHALREALHQGPAAADARYRLVRDRYDALRRLSPDLAGDSLFFQDTDGPRTGVLDAMEVVALEGLSPPGRAPAEPAPAATAGRP